MPETASVGATASSSNTVIVQNANVLFQEFNPDRENITSYLERFECFTLVNNVASDRKTALFIASVGATVYERLQLLAIPKTPTTLTYDEIKTLLGEEYKKKPLVHVARHNFSERKQKNGESFRDFYNSLKDLSRDCDFGTNDALKEQLKYRIISGIRDSKTQSYFFMQPRLTLDDVVAKALIDEQAGLGVQHFRADKNGQNASAPDSVHGIGDNVKRKKFPNRGNRFSSKNQRPPAEKTNQATDQVPVCFRCARKGHKADVCFYRTAVCNKCKRTGHIAVACGQAREKFRPQSTSKVHQVDDQSDPPYEIVPISSIADSNPDKYTIEKVSCIQQRDPKDKVFTQLLVDGTPVIFEADSGSRFSIMSKSNFVQLNLCKSFSPCKIILQSYTGNFIFVLGCVYVDVTYKSKVFKNLKLLIVDENYDTVFGREWWYTIQFDIFGHSHEKIHRIDTPFDLKNALSNVVIEFNDIFEERTGILKNVMEHVTVDKNVKPIFCRHRNVVYSLRDNVNDEIDRLILTGIYEAVPAADWATPLVVVQKAGGAVRLVGDYSVTVNRAIIPEDYPIPNIEEILCDFGSCSFYSKFDVREAYMHMKVDDETAKLLTVNTTKGLFKVNRLNYGIQSAPAKWQRYVENVFKPVKGCRCFYDDIKISSNNAHVHLGSIKQFLSICRENGIRLKKSKCQLLSNELDYLGFKINEKGIHKTSEKVDAILKAPPPKNVTEVKSFTGLVVFYSRFLPNMSTVLHPINRLLRKGVDFNWDENCQTAFNSIKREIASPRVLCHYDPAKKIILATDASPFAIGAVLSHQFEQGERPIAFASRALSKAEGNYSQIDKESLAIFWGVKRFFNYLFGRPFILYVDCKPLQSIFAKHAAKPALSATRLLHYALFLQGFDYEIRYRRSEDHSNADFLSRFPVEKPAENRMDEPSVVNMQQINTLPMSLDELATESANDPEIAPILQKLSTKTQDTEISIFADYTVEKGCVLFGTRVFVPKKFREAVLKELHVGHLGISKMKGLARSHVYWPGIDREIDNLVRRCEPCQKNARAVSVPSHPWEPPSAPWERVHIDYAGPFLNFSFLLVVDAFSKWPEVFPVPASRAQGTNSEATIEKLIECFARFGCPSTLVSDNGVQFTSREFKEFCARNFIRQAHSPPYHPQSNGQAERYVQTVKRALRIAILENPGESIVKKLQIFLMSYRRAPLACGQSPCQLMLGRKIRSRIDLLRSVEKLSSEFDPHSADGTAVWFRVFGSGRNWERGTLLRRIGNVMVEVRDGDGQTHRRHLSQVRNALPSSEESTDAYPVQADWKPVNQPAVAPPALPPPPTPPISPVIVQDEPPHASPPAPPPVAPAVAAPVTSPRRSGRTRRGPNRFSP